MANTHEAYAPHIEFNLAGERLRPAPTLLQGVFSTGGVFCEAIMPALPWIKWFPADWLSDPTVRACTPATRGIWVDCINQMCLLRTDRLEGHMEDLARSISVSPEAFQSAINELLRHKTADVTLPRNGVVTLVCRRLSRELKEREGNRLRVRRHRSKSAVSESCNADVTEGSLEYRSLVSVKRDRGEGEREVPDITGTNGKLVAAWAAKVIGIWEKHGPIPSLSTEYQTVRANCAELIAYGKPQDKFDLLCEWVTESGSEFRPKSPESMTDPAKWTHWQQLIEEELEEGKRGKGGGRR